MGMHFLTAFEAVLVRSKASHLLFGSDSREVDLLCTLPQGAAQSWDQPQGPGSGWKSVLAFLESGEG